VRNSLAFASGVPSHEHQAEEPGSQKADLYLGYGGGLSEIPRHCRCQWRNDGCLSEINGGRCSCRGSRARCRGASKSDNRMHRLIILGAVALASYSGPKTDLTPWFESLKSSGGGYCCAQADGRETEYDMKDGHYVVSINGKSVQVPDDRVLTQPNRHGHAMVWLDYKGDIRCFIPSSGA